MILCHLKQPKDQNIQLPTSIRCSQTQYVANVKIPESSSDRRMWIWNSRKRIHLFSVVVTGLRLSIRVFKWQRLFGIFWQVRRASGIALSSRSESYKQQRPAKTRATSRGRSCGSNAASRWEGVCILGVQFRQAGSESHSSPSGPEHGAAPPAKTINHINSIWRKIFVTPLLLSYTKVFYVEQHHRYKLSNKGSKMHMVESNISISQNTTSPPLVISYQIALGWFKFNYLIVSR